MHTEEKKGKKKSPGSDTITSHNQEEEKKRHKPAWTNKQTHEKHTCQLSLSQARWSQC